MAVIIAVCFYTLPTLQNRIQYVVWDFKQYTQHIHLQGSADGGRWLSLKGGYEVGMAKPFTGVGFGDIRYESARWYKGHYPAIPTEERFIPHCEWLIYFEGSGLIGMLAFTIGLYLLYNKLLKKNIFSIVIAVVLLIPLITDDTIEGQFGINIFAFVIAMGYHLNKITQAAAVEASAA